MAFPPIPLKDIKDLPFSFQEWLRQLQNLIGGTSGSVPWDSVSKTGASIADIPIRNHNNLQNIQGGGPTDYRHLTTTQLGSISGLGAVKLLGGTGVPAGGLGANGNFYFRDDGGVGTHIYFKVAGAWTAIA
jgi:hypothetical protein